MRHIFKTYNKLVYTLIVALAVALLLIVALKDKLRTWDILEGVAIELIGAVIIFVVIGHLLHIREFDTAKLIATAVKKLESHARFLKSPEQNPPFDELIQGAKSISLLGNSFIRLLRTYEAALKRALDNGATLRLIFLNPEGDGCKALERESKRAVRASIASSLDLAVSLRDYAKSSKAGCVEIRLVEWPSGMGLHIIDPTESNGLLRATIYPPDVSSPLSDRAHFVLLCKEDPHWFKVYTRHYEQLWANATPLTEPFIC